MKRILSAKALLLATALSVSLFAAPQARAEGEVIIGAAIAQSGVIAPYDEGPAQAMEVAIEEINAKGGLLASSSRSFTPTPNPISPMVRPAAQEVIDKGRTDGGRDLRL